MNVDTSSITGAAAQIRIAMTALLVASGLFAMTASFAQDEGVPRLPAGGGFNDRVKTAAHPVAPFIMQQFRWRLGNFNGAEVPNETAWVEFGDDQLTSQTACHELSGQWKIQDGELHFGGSERPLTDKSRPCDAPSDVEAQFVVALKSGPRRFAVLDNTKIIMETGDGAAFMMSAFEGKSASEKP